MRTLVTVSNALVCSILDGCGVDDGEKQRLLEAARLRDETVRDITARTSIVRLAQLWRRVVRATGDPFIGLTIGNAVRSNRFGLGAHVALHGETFREALLRFVKYAPLINDLLECRLEETPPLARFVARLRWNVLGLERHAVDITFAGAARFANDHLAAPFVVRELRLAHGLLAGEPRYRTLFGGPAIAFGADRNELVFDAALLEEPIRARDSQLGILLERYASQELQRLPVVTDLPGRIAQLLRAAIDRREPIELDAIAQALAMSARSMQRKLRDHATSFSTIVDDVRRAAAADLLVAPDANVEQVGFRLGYSEPTAFIRAFKKWYGMTPGTFRRAKTSG